jgi:hypothetical protein
MKTLKSIKPYLLIFGCLTLLATLPGCLGLVTVPMDITKTVEGSTTGKTTITFDAPTIYDTNALSAIQSLAIWPEKQTQQAGLISDVLLAETLSGTNAFNIVTPLEVTETIQTNSLSSALDEMTTDEQSHVFKTVADKTAADAIFFTSGSSTKTDLAVFKLTRASTTDSVTVEIYSRKKNVVVWQDVMNIKLEGETDVQGKCTTQLAKQILQITGRNASAATNSVATATR